MFDVRNDVSNNRFSVVVDGTEGELVYRQVGRRLILVHTGVPESLAGRGVGGALVKAAIEWAGEEHLVVVPMCPFAHKWLLEHPDVANAVDVDWSVAKTS